MYKVKKSDLKGEIKNFPIEVVQKMVNKQVCQGNKADVGVFQKYAFNDKGKGGFEWSSTKEGYAFWRDIIGNLNFNVFFKKYPKKDNTDRPPLGVMPKFIWDRKRIDMIKGGIKRYIDADKPIPVDWITEYNGIIEGKK